MIVFYRDIDIAILPVYIYIAHKDYQSMMSVDHRIGLP